MTRTPRLVAWPTVVGSSTPKGHPFDAFYALKFTPLTYRCYSLFHLERGLHLESGFAALRNAVQKRTRPPLFPPSETPRVRSDDGFAALFRARA